jgi:hypothetical protein
MIEKMRGKENKGEKGQGNREKGENKNIKRCLEI